MYLNFVDHEVEGLFISEKASEHSEGRPCSKNDREVDRIAETGVPSLPTVLAVSDIRPTRHKPETP